MPSEQQASHSHAKGTEFTGGSLSNPPPNSPNTPDVGLFRYFREGELTLQVSYAIVPTSWSEWLANLNATLPRPLELVVPVPDEQGLRSPISTFPLPDSNLEQAKKLATRSLIHVRIPESDMERDETEFRVKAKLRDEALVVVVNQLNQGVNENGGLVIDGVKVEAAAPNWLFTGAPHGFTHGGPGGLPVESLDANPSLNQYEFRKTEISNVIDQCNRRGQKQVNVVILDTVPPAEIPGVTETHVLGKAFAAYKNHPITKKLAPPGQAAKLKIKRAVDLQIDLPPVSEETASHYTQEGDYDMSDHGSFIAGIIDDIAPQADLHLVEVLNHDGVGTVESFVKGLLAIAYGDVLPKPIGDLKQHWALVVNASLCTDLPPADNGQIILKIYDSLNNSQYTLTLNFPSLLLSPMEAAVELFYQAFNGSDVQIVAAAGNDGEQGVDPPPSTYPAAFNSVLSVGALDNNGHRAYYSNLANNPNPNGVMVFGGAANPCVSQEEVNGKPAKKWNETDSAGGILGLYVRKFPHPDPATGKIDRNNSTPSKHGWGRWSGTSFAAGVMSGVLAYAALQGCTISLKKSGNIIETLIGEALGQNPPKKTDFDEAIMDVSQ